MVWVPTKGKRAGVRARFADLMNEPKQVSMRFSPAEIQNEKTTTNSASRAPIDVSTGQDSKQTAMKASQGSAGSGIGISGSKANGKSSMQKDLWDRHHIPPKHPRKYIIKRVKRSHHEAFNLLFGSSGSLEECIAILKKHWWPTSL